MFGMIDKINPFHQINVEIYGYHELWYFISYIRMIKLYLTLWFIPTWGPWGRRPERSLENSWKSIFPSPSMSASFSIKPTFFTKLPLMQRRKRKYELTFAMSCMMGCLPLLSSNKTFCYFCAIIFTSFKLCRSSLII